MAEEPNEELLRRPMHPIVRYRLERTTTYLSCWPLRCSLRMDGPLVFLAAAAARLSPE